MRSRLALTPLVLVLALAGAGTAQARFFAGEPIDGPSADLRFTGDVDVARDGGGAIAYIRREGPADHLYASRLINGLWQPPERIDAGLESPASQPAVAASDGGRLTVVFVSGGQVFSVVRPAGAPGWSAPALVAPTASNPSVDMSINGVAYTTFTQGGDVRAARLERDAPSFNVLAAPLDIDPGRAAGEGARRSRVAVSADGTALAVWGEDGGDGRTHVYGRRLFGVNLSTAPQDLTLDELDGRAGRSADSPDVDIEDDSSFAWVVFRQEFDDGGTLRGRAIARRLVGSQFEAPTVVDGLGWGGESAITPRIDLNGRGEGVATNGSSSSFGALAAMLKDDAFFSGSSVGGGGVSPQPVGTVAETTDRVVGWLQGGGVLGAATAVHARYFDDKPAERTPPLPGPEEILTNADFGGVDPEGGFDAVMNRAGDVVFAFIQGTGSDRRLMIATYDRAPGAFRGYSSQKWRKFARPPLAWGPAFDLWGPITYHVEVDGQEVAQTQDTRITLPNVVADGERRWRVVAVDRRGQSTASPSRLLRVDATPPRVSFRVRRRGRAVTVTARANDVIPPGARASGVRYVRVYFGDRTRTVMARKWTHFYARGGAYRVRVSATDRAGNAKVVSRRIRVKG